MPSAHSISVVIPAFNEEENILAAVQTVLGIIPNYFSDYELLIYDDGSSDRTGLIAEELARKTPTIGVIRHRKNQGLGSCYREGARIASKEYYLLIHGDNEIAPETIQRIIEKAGKADMVISYILNPQARPLSRRIISKTYTLLTNFLFGLKLPYYNGPSLIKTSLVKELPIENTGFGFMTETLVKLIKLDHSYVPVGFNCRLREKGRTKAFRLKNLISVILGILYFRLSLDSFVNSYQNHRLNR